MSLAWFGDNMIKADMITSHIYGVAPFGYFVIIQLLKVKGKFMTLTSSKNFLFFQTMLLRRYKSMVLCTRHNVYYADIWKLTPRSTVDLITTQLFRNIEHIDLAWLNIQYDRFFIRFSWAWNANFGGNSWWYITLWTVLRLFTIWSTKSIYNSYHIDTMRFRLYQWK